MNPDDCGTCQGARQLLSHRPRIIDLVEDRDLWRFAHDPDTRRFHAVAASYGYEATAANLARWDAWHDDSVDEVFARRRPTIEELETVLQRDSHQGIEILPSGEIVGTKNNWANLLNEGAAILRAEAKLVEGIVRGTRRTMRLVGHVVPVACCPGALASEVGNALCRLPVLFCGMEHCFTDDVGNLRPHLSATYYDGADGRRHFSLRSTDASPFHCGNAARHLGERQGRPGGGHKNAAGFDAPLGWEGE